MPDMFFLSAPGPALVHSLRASLGTERVLWTGHCAIAEYAFEEPNSLPRWTLPEETEVFITETRVAFIDPTGQAGGELHWPSPQHLRVQPGNRDTGRSATVTQIQLVCAGPAGAFPALVLAGGDLSTVGDADRLANVLRQSIARFRVEFATDLGVTAPQARMLSRLVIGPEFNNYQGGEGQTVSLLGGIPIDQPVAPEQSWAPEPAWEPEPAWQPEPFLDEYLPPTSYPPAEYAAHPYADYAPLPVAAWDEGPRPGYAPEPIRSAEPPYTDLASRAADLAARVANLVSANSGAEQSLERFEAETTNLSTFLAPEDAPADGYAEPGEDRAETMRRTAIRFAANSARARATGQRPAGDRQNFS